MYKLTHKQGEILALLVKGQTQKEAARTLSIHKKTLEYHLKKTRENWNCTTTVQLAAKVPEWRLSQYA